MAGPVIPDEPPPPAAPPPAPTGQADRTDRARKEHEHFFGAARVVAGLTMISRVLGFVRDAAIVPIGSALVADAFWTAFAIPHLFRRLFGEGALSAAFIPIFSETAEKHGWDRARQVLSNTAGLLALALTAITVLIELALLACLLWAPGDLKNQLAMHFTMLMLPFMIFVCLLALCSSALNSKGHFAYPAAAPAFLNVGLIVAGRLIAPLATSGDEGRLAVVAVGLVICGIAQVGGVIWLLKRTGLLSRWNLRPVLPEIKQILWGMAPTIIPLGMMQFCEFASRIIALAFTATPADPTQPLMPGVVRCLYTAGRLYQLPLGVLAVSISTVAFPLLSRCVARGDEDGVRDVLSRALRLCLFLGIPAGVGLMLVAEPLIAAAFQRDQFTLYDTLRTTWMLQWYSAAMPAYFCLHVLLRAFFARKDTRTPMIASAVLAALNLALVTGGFFTPLGSSSLGMATAVTSTLNVVILAWALHRRVGRLGWRPLLHSAGRVSVATALMAAAMVAVQWWLEAHGSRRVVVLSALLLVGGAAFLAAAKLFRCEELGELLRRGRREPAPAAAAGQP